MKQLSKPSLIAVAITALGLSACGGGDSAATAPAAVTTSFSGTAATGAAMANANVAISCASGTGSTTTTANGSYSANLSNITLPCVLRATSTDGATVLYSVTTATPGAAQVANITPLTHLVVASLSGADPAAFFSGFNATTASAVTASSVSAAQTAVLTTLANAGVDTTGLTDLIGGALVGGSGSGYDGVLDAVQTLLTSSGTSLTELANSVAATSPSATVDHTARLPASLLLKTAASNCAALRSGEYVDIQPRKGTNLAGQIDTSTLNASNLTWTDGDGSTGTFEANGDCRYKMGTDEYIVSKAGILMGVYVDDDSTPRLSFVIPKQTIAVSELAGAWNALGFQKNDAGTAYVAETVTADISTSGAFTNVNQCVGARLNDTCTTSTTTINLIANSTGGFDWVGSGTSAWTERAFAYRAGSGDLMLVTLGGGGSIHIWTKQRTLGFPLVGEIYTGGASVRMNNQLVPGTLDVFPNGASVVAVDTAAGTITRTQTTLAGGPDYNDTVTQNSPLAGYNFRAAGTTTATDGRTVNIRERTSLSMRGMGISFQSVPHVSSFQMSVD